MIPVTRLNGSVFAINPDLVVRADSTPDTVLTLVDGSKYVVVESIDEYVALVVAHRARVVHAAAAPGEWPEAPPAEWAGDDDAQAAPRSAPQSGTQAGTHAVARGGSTVVPLRPRRA